jgi:hypothetical protein
VKLLKGEFHAGDHVYIDEADNELTFTKVESAEMLRETDVETAV